MEKNTKRFLSLVLSLVLALAMLPSMVFAADYENHWAKSQIESLIEKGIVTPDPGTGNTNPNRNLTRAEMSRLINQAFGLTETADISDLTDVPADSWFAEDIAKAVAAGYLKGYGDGTIRPNGQITRQEVAQVATSFLKLSPAPDMADSTDAAQISEWARGAVGAALEGGLMSGYPDGSFKPLNNMTRAEAFVVLLNMMSDGTPAEEVEEESVTVGADETFGNADEVKTVGNMVIDGSGATVMNTIVKGDLTITEAVGDGDVFLEGVEVLGSTYVKGGGANSIRIKDGSRVKSHHTNMIVSKLDVTIRLETGEIVRITFETGGKLVNSGGTVSVTIIDTNGKVTITGEFNEVIMQMAGGNLVLSDAVVELLQVLKEAVNSIITNNQGSSIAKAIVEAISSFHGTGTIKEMEAKAPGITTENKPGTVTGEDVTVVPPGTGTVVPPTTDDDIPAAKLRVNALGVHNSNTLEVTFSTEVDKETAEKGENYEITGAGVASASASANPTTATKGDGSSSFAASKVRITFSGAEFGNVKMGEEITVTVKDVLNASKRQLGAQVSATYTQGTRLASAIAKLQQPISVRNVGEVSEIQTAVDIRLAGESVEAVVSGSAGNWSVQLTSILANSLKDDNDTQSVRITVTGPEYRYMLVQVPGQTIYNFTLYEGEQVLTDRVCWFYIYDNGTLNPAPFSVNTGLEKNGTTALSEGMRQVGAGITYKMLFADDPNYTINPYEASLFAEEIFEKQ